MDKGTAQLPFGRRIRIGHRPDSTLIGLTRGVPLTTRLEVDEP
ncbi:MAG TPA: hypothetical protein VFP94_08850 [Terriglobales bacterium]|nr:hypothetical protein [Terriglobales bacterium]